MGTQKAKRHTHKYRLVPMNASTKVWACALPDCNHYMPPNMANMIEGKQSECWDCGKSTTMSVDRMKFAIEHNEGMMLCQDCMDKRRGTFIEPIDDIPDMDSIVALIQKGNKQ